MDIINADVFVVLAVVFIIVVAIVPSDPNNGVRLCGICAAILIVIIYFVLRRTDAVFMIKVVLDFLLSFGSLVLIGITLLLCFCCGIVAATANKPTGGKEVARW